jgi:hypothetical protein
MEVSGQLHVPAALFPGKEPGTQRGGLPSRYRLCGEETILSLYRDSNSDPSVVQPVASRYTD